MLDCSLEQGFAIGTRDKHAGADRKLDCPEGAGAGDIGDRLVHEAAGEERREGGGFGGVEMGEEQGFARDAERVGHEQLGIEARRLAE